ncbi:reverse transcriptase-RNase H-integrase [Sanghuangporus baumii]|uniref:Reverse transcriptase-RNase H-integrase n=1 Tax=Sanghuangporus baumii TaxID=108892 RepID=A0A9Q5HQ68_SANBA|nr:reverse transcriptase-RNase H-integrase [Sanghuangporus baumii]
MYQGDLNADEFFNKFDICQVDAGLVTEAHNEWLMSHLKRALNPKVVKGVIRLPNEPTSYKEFKRAAVKVDRVKRQIRDLMAECRQKAINVTVMKPAPAPPMRCPMLPQQAAHPFVPSAQDHCDATEVTYRGLDESEDDDDNFKVYKDLFVRRADAQAGELREEEQIQTTIKNEVVAEEPYRKNIVARVNITKAVWDMVGRHVAEVWHEGIKEAEQFVRRASGKELDAFISIVHPKVIGDGKVDLSNPGLEDEHFIDAHALIDLGCTGSCINKGFVKRYGFPTQRYIRPRPVFNADSTSNEGGLIKEYVMLQMFFGKHEEEIRLAVTSLASSNIFLGHNWLQKHNPEIDWKIGSVKFTRCPDECDSMLSKEEIDDEYVRNVRMKEAAKWPPYLEEYADVFSEESFKHLPNHQMWDHAINLKLDFKPSDYKVYPLSPKEQEAMKEFIEENLVSGHIRQSKSPMTSPFFFIKKEDGSLRAIQDYRKLNKGTVKNKYPLPLINKLIDKVKDAKYITKLNIHWGYYNIQIREGDEWKAAFRTNLGLFEPTVIFFAEFNFTLVHKPGKTLGKADLLSHRADYNKGKHDNENVTFIKKEWLVRGMVQMSRDGLIKKVTEAQRQEDEGMRLKDVKKRGDVWRKGHRLYIPAGIREIIMKEHHDSILAGHLGAIKMIQLIAQRYWWPKMSADVQVYVQGCDHYQQMKALRTMRAKVLHPNEVPEAPWQIVTVDLIRELPESNRFNAICIVVDHFSKQIHMILMMRKLTAEGMARIYRDHIFWLHGLPQKIIYDRGVQFDARMMKELYKLLHIEGNLSTAYHPQTDGQMERVNQELEQYLHLYINHRQSDWVDQLVLAEFAYNNCEHSATKLSPFFVNTGMHPLDFMGVGMALSNLSVEDFAKHVKEVHRLTQSNLVKANEDMKCFYDCHAGKSVSYEAGQKVFLDRWNIKMIRLMKKMDDKWFGPFEVVEKISVSAYRLKLLKTWKKVHPVFNEILLKLAVQLSFESQKKPPLLPLVIIDKQEEYEVEEILDSHLHQGRLQFLIK